MDEQRAWLKARRKRCLRILAVMLSFCVLFHTYPDILATLSVLAAVESVQPEVRLITDFTVLSEEIREQTVPVGTALSELTLPDALEAVVTGQTSEDTEDKTDDGGKEDAGENGSDEDSEENDGEEPDDTEDEDGGTGETEEGEPDDTEQEDTETGGETGDKDAETGDGQDEQPEDGESEETDGTTETENGDEGDSETEENSEGESVSSEEQGGSENGQENMPLEERQESVPAQETHTVTMPEYLLENVISVQTLENTQTEKEEETVTIDGVTWQSEPEYDENTEGTYIFTAILPDGYALAEGVSLPEITVTVESGIDAIIQALRDRIAALPEVEDYLSSEPDMDDEDAYAEWEEKLYAYAKEALAIWEEYEALTEEQQAQISEEEMVKLTAWMELAGTLEESSQVMTANGVQHKHCVCGGNINIGDHTTHTEDIVYDNILASDNGQLLINGILQSDYTLTSGNYYLEGDVALSSELVIAENSTVYICLNNQAISYNRKNGKHRVITVEKGATLNLCTCGDSGVITGGDFDNMGGGLYLLENSIFNMYGGSIEGNRATAAGGGIFSYASCCNLYKVNICGNEGSNGAGIIFSNTLNVYGGEIKNNNATGIFGGGIATGSAEKCILQNVKICNNTAKGYAGGLYWANGNLVMSDVEISNNIVSNSTARYQAGGVALMQGTISISGAITISGNQYNGSPNNLCNTYANSKNPGKLFIVGTLDEQSVIGLTNKNVPTEENPDPVEVASGSNHLITAADWSCFFSDDKKYKIIKDGNALFLALPGACDLSGLDLTAEGAELKPNFQADITTYTATVGNEVDKVDITATLADSTDGKTIKIKNGTVLSETDMTSGVKKEVPLVVGLNEIEITVTSGSETKTYTLNITREAPADNPVTITPYKDGAEWTASAPVFKLTSDSGSTFVTDLTAVPDGTYSIYYDYDGDTNIDTGKTVSVNGAPPDDIRVDYFTVTFYDEGKVLTSPAQQIVLEGAAASAPATNPTKTGYTLKWVTTDGGSTEYDFANKTVTAKTSVYASWTATEYTITYNGIDGATLSTKPEKHTYGKDTSVGNPTKTGYTFAGWKVNSGSTATKNLTLGATDYTAAITLTATWTAEQYDITYSGMDGAALSTKPEKHTYGKDTEVGDPTKEGYTFAGWKVNDSTTATTSLTLGATAYTAAITLTATWTPNTYQVTLDNHGATGGDLTVSQTVTYGGKYGLLPVPSRTGYTFKGWYTAEAEGQGTKVDADTIVATADNHTLHARWKDETAPDKPVLQDNVTLPKDWTNAQDKIPLKLYDGVGVTELWVSIDGSDSYTKIDGFTPGTGSVTYDYPSVLEGEHTYRFKAVDAAGNTSAESDLFTVKLDQTKPVIGTLTYDNQVHLNLWNWIIGKKSMVVHVPVTDIGSGVELVSYTLTPINADGTLDESKAEKKTAEVRKGEAEIAFDKDFRGIITINCTDKAGNAADSKTIGTEGAGGVIVEDTPPAITTNAKTDYYDTPTDIKVTVKDDPDNAISAGIASITYQVGEDGEEQSVNVATDALKTEVIFDIPASQIPTGITEITVTATDNAGNEATKAFTVKVKGPEKTPAAEINYRQEKLTKLVPGGTYDIDGTEYTADTDGCIPIKDDWFGTTINIIKKGNGNETTDSPAQSLPIPARPAAPNAPELDTRTDSSITLKTITGAQYRLAEGTGNWQDSTAFTGLAQKTIYKFKAYYPATDASFASLESNEAQIATMPTAPTKEKLVIGYKAETLTLTDGIEAFTDAGCQNPVSGGDVTAYMGQTIYIRYPAKGIIPASLTTAVPVPARPAKPTPGKTDASYPTATDGAITGLTSGTTYEYRVKNTDGSFSAWKDATPSGTKIENLPAGAYEIRVKAVETGNASFQSETAAVTIGEMPGVKITFMADGDEYAVRHTKNGGILTEIPPVPAKENAIGAWYMDEQGTTPAVFTNITADMTVYAVYTTVYTVTLQTGTGYTLSAETGSQSPVREGGSFTFRFTLSNGYQKTADFAVKVNGMEVELTAQEPYTYTISDIRENKTVTVEGVAKKPGKPADSGDKDKGDDPEPENPAPKPEDTNPDNPSPRPPVTPPAKPTPPEQAPGTPTAEKQPESRPGTRPKKEETAAPEESTEPEKEPGTETPEPDGTGTETAESTDTGQTKGTPTQQAEVRLGNGTVIVTVVCEEEKCTAAVADIGAVVKAVLTSDQQALVNGGETIEIRIDVTDISEKVPAQDKEVIGSGIEAYSEEVPGLVLGMYVDISMFIRIGGGDWNAITETDEPIEVVVNIPEKLLSDGREYYIIRAHNGEYTFMNDIDDKPETITISTELFSSYAIAYVKTDGTDTDIKCGLCHICPTFFGICYFIWLAVILALALIIYFVIRRRKRQEEEKQEK